MSNNEILKHPNGLCRCCLNVGCFKDINSPCERSEGNGKYFEMLAQCFSVNLKTVIGNVKDSICDFCITRLRDSYAFWKLVLESEEKIIQKLRVLNKESNDSAMEIKIEYEAETNCEETRIAPKLGDTCPHEPALEQRAGLSSRLPLVADGKPEPYSGTCTKADDSEPESIKSECLLDRNDLTDSKEDSIEDKAVVMKLGIGRIRKGSKMRKTHDERVGSKKSCQSEIKSNKNFKISNDNVVQDKIVTMKLGIRRFQKVTKTKAKPSVENDPKKEISLKKLSESKSNLKAADESVVQADLKQSGNKLDEYKGRVNACTLLENTTSSPFRWCGPRGFNCFYCTSKESNMVNLREHTATHKQDKLKTLVHSKRKNRFIKIDITNLSCRICSRTFEKLANIKTHLTEEHNIRFLKTPRDFVVPFKLNDPDLICAICDKVFTNFHTLNNHMNAHYGNFVCETCGATFLYEERLNLHLNTHNNGLYPCKSCSKNFDTSVKLSNHKSQAHSNIKHRCHSCGEVFKTFHLKLVHRIRVHDEKHLLHTCELCSKTYSRKSHLNYHIRREHVQEKNFVCQVCNHAFFSKQDLSNHNLKHSGEKSHECQTCNKSFCRKQYLVQHMRMHNDDRRFVCTYCGQGFIQSCNLKGHLKTRHSLTL